MMVKYGNASLEVIGDDDIYYVHPSTGQYCSDPDDCLIGFEGADSDDFKMLISLMKHVPDIIEEYVYNDEDVLIAKRYE